MPVVKTYQPRIESAPLRGGERTGALTEAATGAAMGGEIAKLGFKIQEEEGRRQDEVAFLEADRKLGEWENNALYHPETGALSKRGKDSFGVPDAVNADLKTNVQAIRESLSNDRQRLAFDRAANARTKDINKTLSRHVFTEARKHEDVETENYIKNASQTAILNFNDPERVGLEIEKARAAVVDYSRRNGMGADYQKQKLAQVESNIHVGIVDRFLSNGQDQQAKLYFDQAKKDDRIAGDDIQKVEAKLKSALIDGEGLRGAADIWTRLGPKNDTDPVNSDLMVKDAEKKYANDPTILKAVKQGIVERASLHNASQRERAEGNEAAVWGYVNERKSLPAIKITPEWRAMSPKRQAAIENEVLNLAHQRNQRGRSYDQQAETDKEKATFGAYWVYSQVDNLAGMSEAQIVNLTDVLGRNNVTRLMEKKRSLVKSEDKVIEARIDEDLFKRGADAAGLKPYEKSPSEDHKAALGRMRDHVERVIDVEQRNAKRPLKREEKELLMDREIDKKVMIDAWGRDKQVVAGAVSPKDRAAAYVPIQDIPMPARLAIVNQAKSWGTIAQNVTPEIAYRKFGSRIEKAYAAGLMGATETEMRAILTAKQ